MSSSESTMPGVAFVIPALDEEVSIGEVVRSVLLFGQALVVDDGSRDRTGEFASAAGARVLRHAQRQGYDAAIADGIQCAADQGFDWAVTIDADGQHAASNLPHVTAYLNADVDLVVGIRARRPRMAEQLMALLFRWRWGISDPLCGLKAYRLSCYRAHRMRGNTYASIGTEIMLHYLRAGARVAQLPITIHARADQPRFGNRISANARILGCLFVSIGKGWGRTP